MQINRVVLLPGDIPYNLRSNRHALGWRERRIVDYVRDFGRASYYHASGQIPNTIYHNSGDLMVMANTHLLKIEPVGKGTGFRWMWNPRFPLLWESWLGNTYIHGIHRYDVVAMLDEKDVGDFLEGTFEVVDHGAVTILRPKLYGYWVTEYLKLREDISKLR